MPPLPLNSLFSKELVNVPVKLLYSRQELLRKIIANAAKRKVQIHIDATGDRMAAHPEAFQFGKQIFDSMHKKSNVLTSPLIKRLVQMAGKTMGGLKTYGKRLVGDSTLKPLRQRADLLSEMGHDLATNLPNPENIATNMLRYAPRQVGNPTQAVMNARRARNTGFEAYKQLNTQSLDALKALFQEQDAIRKTRLYTGGAASGATLGGVGAAALSGAGEKQSETLPTPSSRGETKKVTMPSENKQQPDLDPEGVQMTQQDHDVKKQAGLGALLGGGLGAGIGGLAGAAGGGLLGGGIGGALGGKRGGGLGVLAGGALGLGAGAHLGGNIGASIGKKKKKKEPEKQDDDDKDVKEAAASLLAFVQKNNK